MSATIDTSLTPLVGVLTIVIGIAVYVWLSLALSAMFRKMGEESWKGWVPFLNVATVLRWGGFSPLLALLLLIPGAGLVAVLVLLVISAHRINPGFGYGGGMTVLAALLFVVWASILGFGPAAWRGARPSLAAAVPPGPGAPPPLPPLPPTTAAHAAASTAAASGFPAAPPLPPPPASAPAAFPAASTAFPGAAPANPLAARPVIPPAPAPSWAPPSYGVEPPSPPAPTGEPDVAAWPSEVDDVSAVSPSPFPPNAAGGPRRSGVETAPEAPADAPAPNSSVPADPPGLISFVPGRSAEPAPEAAPAASPAVPAVAPVAAAPAEAAPEPVRAPETAPLEVPAPRRAGSDAEAFPELTGEVSAVAGSPAAGAPLSARSSVAAQQRDLDGVPETPGEDDVDQTVIVRRKKITWQLMPASGVPVPLTADVVILGRRPSADPSFPTAQLVAVQDDARTVSKTHARLELRADRWAVTDLGSTNGVLVRTLMGEEIEIDPGTEIEAGERFFLGDEEFHLQHD